MYTISVWYLIGNCETKQFCWGVWSNITKSIKLKSPDKNGFLWGLEKLENYNKPKKLNEKRKVGKFDLTGNLVQEYDSATKAANENGTSVWKVLSGTNNTHKGYIYKYIN